MQFALSVITSLAFFFAPGDTSPEKLKSAATRRQERATEGPERAANYEKKSPLGYKHYVRGNGISDTDPERAVEQYKLAVEKGYDTVELRMKMGNILRTLQRPEEAIVQYRVAIGLDERSVRPHIALAHALLDHGQHGEALKEFEIIKTLAPEDFMLGIFSDEVATCLDALGRYEEALEAYQTAIRCNCNADPRDELIKKRIEEIKRLLANKAK